MSSDGEENSNVPQRSGGSVVSGALSHLSGVPKWAWSALNNVAGNALGAAQGKKAVVAADYQNQADIKRRIGQRAMDLLDEKPELLDKAAARLIEDALIEQDNRESVVQLAAKELKTEGVSEDTVGPDAEVSGDWLRNFSKYAEQFSEHDFQLLWAKVLAGEVRQPGTVSRGLLSTVYELERRDIELIEKYGKLITDGDFIPIITNDHFGDLMRLQELGFVQGVNGLIKDTYSLSDNGSHAIRMNGLHVHVMGKPGKKHRVPGVVATSKFGEIVKVLSLKSDYLSACHVSKVHGFDDWADSINVVYVGGCNQVIKGDPVTFDQLDRTDQNKVK